ncbi:hypothetical protein C2R81_01220 [Helicobacter pylori]|uniref:hypothetical protein n=1 Tax=Helicobacter pylori TaxID=210 RepID=UPI000D3D82FA|nr:hypothetical protein [Helicobacter pylori]PUD41035.1 hypothetical protein C2R81_01220 [Helicobacter pylori]
MMKEGYIRGDLMRIIKSLFLVSFVAYSSAFATDLETETKNDKKLYDFTKNSGLEGIDLEKSPNLKSHKKSDKKFYKQLAKNNIAEGVSVPIVNFNKALSFGPYFERTKSKKTQYMDGGLMMHIRF